MTPRVPGAGGSVGSNLPADRAYGSSIHRSSAMLARQLARPAVINIDQRIGARAEAIAFYVSAPAAREGPGEAHDEYLAALGHLRASRA